jgi:hypothetical protein
LPQEALRGIGAAERFCIFAEMAFDKLGALEVRPDELGESSF